MVVFFLQRTTSASTYRGTRGRTRIEELHESARDRRFLLWPAVFLWAGVTLAQTAEVTHNVNLRSDPSTKHRAIRLLRPTERVALLDSGETAGYYHVKTSANEAGWVRSDNVHVLATPAPTTPPTPSGRGQAAAVNLETTPPAGGHPIILVLAGMTTLGCVALLVRKERARRKQVATEDEARRQAALSEFESLSRWTDRKNWPNLNQEVSGVILGESETCVALSPGVKYIEFRKHTHYEGRTAGISVRIMKGVSLRTGGFAGRPVTTVSPELADYGTILVTDRRILFTGGREVIEVPLKKLADVRAEIGRLELLVANRPNPLEFQLSEAYRAPVIAGAAKLMAGVAQARPRGKA